MPLRDLANRSKSDVIRELAAEGISTSEIARRLSIRYQHAYNVLRASEQLVKRTVIDAPPIVEKPRLSVAQLLDADFVLAGRWVLSSDTVLRFDAVLPRRAGVYAFAQLGQVQYVGVAKTSLAQRLYFYHKPAATQATNIRLNSMLRDHLATSEIKILIATPPDLLWNGLPVSGAAGLEIGLIQNFMLPWNVQGAR